MTVATGLLYFNYAWFREQLCVVVCPYGRLQSVLTDTDTVVIGYDVKRDVFPFDYFEETAEAELSIDGTSYESPYTWTTKFGPGRTDGASSVRIVKYTLNCVTDPESGEKRGCFKLSGGDRPAG